MSGIDDWLRRHPGVMRIGLILVPSIIQGGLGSLSLYAPLIFGRVLANLVKRIKKWRKEPSVLWMAVAVGAVFGFLGLCWYKEVELKPLANFFLSSFVSPMIRWMFPVHGSHIVHGLLGFGLASAWIFQGIDTIFVGFLFLQAIPEVQRKLYFRPTAEKLFIAAVVIVSLPFISIGICAWWFPTFLEYFPVPFLRVLCFISNATPSLPDYYEVLSLPHGASDRAIRRAFRDAAITLHPDKVGSDPVLLAKYHLLSEAMETLTKPAEKAAYDETLLHQEMSILIPRCVHYMMTMVYWVAHLIIDHNEIENYKEDFKASFRRALQSGRFPINEDQCGISTEQLIEYSYNEDNEMPFIRDRGCRGKESVMKLRAVLEKAEIPLGSLPEMEEDDPKWAIFAKRKYFSRHGPLRPMRKVGNIRSNKAQAKDMRIFKRYVKKLKEKQGNKTCSVM